MTHVMSKGGQHRITVPVAEMIRDASCTANLTDSVILTDQIRVLDLSRLQDKIGVLSQTALIGLLELGLAYLFDIPVS
jgi:mRNA-degrading endonuclease toxin of MazEF toxin-antitoxin module